MPETKQELTIFGHEFYVQVRESSDERTVKFIDKEQFETEMHSYVIYRDERRARSGGILRGGKEAEDFEEL